ncbi:HAD family hydrolase [Silvibacterium acidisoli]|uniref:HAD family hydrolase n=1 Tax=Acidobacteriaceae bacterium ZG23-2 TaxID=2883246 RepID=UPI00406C5AFE
MSQISTILWDVGGVLLTNGWDHEERADVLKQFGVEKAEFEEFHPEANDEWEKGQISVEEYLNRTLFRKPRSFTAAEFLAAMKAQSEVLPDSALGILDELAASETVDLGLLNNEAAELNDYRIEEFGFRTCFDFFFSSCYVGLRKPDERIYRLALNVLQAEPDEVAFIDDRAGNVETARSLGIHAIQYEGSAKLAKDLAALGILIETN